MGTRNAIIVAKKKPPTSIKTAEEFLSFFVLYMYSQWDGYIASAGKEMYQFLKKIIEKEGEYDKFKQHLLNYNGTLSDQEQEEISDRVDALHASKFQEIDETNIKMLKELAWYKLASFGNSIENAKSIFEEEKKLGKVWNSPEEMLYEFQTTRYSLTGDCGASIFNLMYENMNKTIPTFKCDVDWPTDTLYCEYAYVWNLETDELHILCGSQDEPEPDDILAPLVNINTSWVPPKTVYKKSVFDLVKMTFEEFEADFDAKFCDE